MVLSNDQYNLCYIIKVAVLRALGQQTHELSFSAQKRVAFQHAEITAHVAIIC